MGELVMIRLIAASAAGLLVGAVAAHLLTRASLPTEDPIVRDLRDVPKISESDAAEHRDARYTGIATIEQVLALPTEFAQSEALYVLAGRSDPAGVQQLIFEANRIADDHVRRNSLGILFERLAEIDPQSALALAGTEYFQDLPELRDVVWQAWGRRDLDAALTAAGNEAAFFERNRAAQALYAAFGFMGNAITDRIEAALDVAPDRSVRARFIYRKFEQSADDAVRWIEALPRSSQRAEYISFLAYYLTQTDPDRVATVASLFERRGARDYFQSTADSYVASIDPAAAVERALAAGYSDANRSAFMSAIAMLARDDPEAAIAYFDGLQDREVRHYVAGLILDELAHRDPAAALAWARANEIGADRRLERTALARISETDPQLAVAEAMKSGSFSLRVDLLGAVLSQIAGNEPREIAVYLEQVEPASLRDEVATNFIGTWIRSDADAALDWILAQDDVQKQSLLRQASYMLANTDVDTAIEVLPLMDAASRQMLRQQIVRQLVIERSATAAQAFVRQFRGEPDFAQLQAGLIGAVAETDTVLARQLAEEIADAGARDAASALLVSQQAAEDPRAASTLLATITDETQRAEAAGSVAMHWYQSEPDAARQWLRTLPAGKVRDRAILSLSGLFREPGSRELALIEDISDEYLRGQAKMQIAANVARTDPELARALIEDPDIPAERREQMQEWLRQTGVAF